MKSKYFLPSLTLGVVLVGTLVYLGSVGSFGQFGQGSFSGARSTSCVETSAEGTVLFDGSVDDVSDFTRLVSNLSTGAYCSYEFYAMTSDRDALQVFKCDGSTLSANNGSPSNYELNCRQTQVSGLVQGISLQTNGVDPVFGLRSESTEYNRVNVQDYLDPTSLKITRHTAAWYNE